MLKYNKKPNKLSETPLLYKNASMALKCACHAKAGETLTIISDKASYQYAEVLAKSAFEIGVKPIIIDLSCYKGLDGSYEMEVIKPLKSAIENADFSIMTIDHRGQASFGTFLGTREEGAEKKADWKECDKALTGVNRRYSFMTDNMDLWEVTPETIEMNIRRTKRILELLKSGKELHMKTPVGTDLKCAIGSSEVIYPILGIVPFYAEIAMMPTLESITGIYAVDGATQHGGLAVPVRPDCHEGHELDLEPLIISIEKGIVKSYTGHQKQVERLETFFNSGNPRPVFVDEVAMVITTIKENNINWLSDGTHQIDHMHIALGNSPDRVNIIHGPKHMDMEACHPEISIDGVIIYRDGAFIDENIFD